MGENPEVPLPKPQRLNVGIIYNLKSDKKHDDVPDAEAEYDSIDTVLAIKAALEKGGCTVSLIEDDGNLPEKLKANRPDLAFNIAEGRGGRGREGQVPSLLGYYGIPYTGSDETTLCIALDKALTKRLVASYGVRTPKSVLVEAGRALEYDLSGLHFPLIVKPNAEGSGKGISDISIVETPAELDKLLKRNIKMYGSDMLVEEYIDGGEFTVGLIGNGKDTRVFRPMELVYRKHTQGAFNVYSYTVKRNYTEYVDYVCPAKIPPKVEKEMTDAALTAYRALNCHDLSRVDFRTDREGNVYFIEINPLPGLAPGYSDYPMLAAFCGTDYDTLVNSVLAAARARLGL
jgi:D-alanine-D-alanine ligase